VQILLSQLIVNNQTAFKNFVTKLNRYKQIYVEKNNILIFKQVEIK